MDRSTPSDGREKIWSAYMQLVGVEMTADIAQARGRDVGYQALRRKAGMNADPFSRHLKRLETEGIVVRPARKVRFLTVNEQIDRATFAQHNFVNDMLYCFRFVDPKRWVIEPGPPSRAPTPVPFDKRIPWAPEGAESWGDYADWLARRLKDFHLEVATNVTNRAVKRRLIRVIQSDANWVD